MKIGAYSTCWAESEIHIPLNRMKILNRKRNRYGDMWVIWIKLLSITGTFSTDRIQLMTEVKPMMRYTVAELLALIFRHSHSSAAFSRWVTARSRTRT